MEIFGYKCFEKDLINIYGKKFSVGKIYVAPGIIKFGTHGNGFHMCKNIEDTFRYFDTSKTDICVCEVIGSGNIDEFNDEYNGYYEMYAVEKLKITKKLSRQELIQMGLNLDEIRVRRFISTLVLTTDEISLFKEKFNKSKDILNAIAYYQENDKEVYIREFKKNR
jgi:hypothetical protein